MALQEFKSNQQGVFNVGMVDASTMEHEVVAERQANHGSSMLRVQENPNRWRVANLRPQRSAI
jgi:hypothetical protein